MMKNRVNLTINFFSQWIGSALPLSFLHQQKLELTIAHVSGHKKITALYITSFCALFYHAANISDHTKYRLGFLVNNYKLQRISKKRSWSNQVTSGNCTGGIEKTIRKFEPRQYKSSAETTGLILLYGLCLTF